MTTFAGRMLGNTFRSIYVVNLPDRTDRRREMREQMERLGLGQDSPRWGFWQATRPSHPADFATIGTRGCYESHAQLLRYASNSRDPVLILEDDLDFHPDIERLLPPVLSTLPQCDIFYGSALNYKPERLFDIVPPETGLAGTHFYALRGNAIKAAADFLERKEAGPIHVDAALSVFRRTHPEFTTCVADLGYQRLSRTDVHDLAFYDRSPVLRLGAAMARNALKSAGMRRWLLR